MTDAEKIIELKRELRTLEEELLYVRAEQHATERILLLSERNLAQLRYQLAPNDETRLAAVMSLERAESDLREFKAKIRAEVKEPRELIQRGMKALDEVKHCLDLMTPDMAINDDLMRHTIPAKWTEANVRLSELAMEKLKEGK